MRCEYLDCGWCLLPQRSTAFPACVGYAKCTIMKGNKMIKFKLSEGATLPKRGSEHAAGFDLYSINGAVIPAGKSAIFQTGVSVDLPYDTYGKVSPRSGLMFKHQVIAGEGVIDPDFVGEISVILFNLGQDAYTVEPGDRIAQLVVHNIVTEAIEVDYIEDTERGSNGFGSTGK